MSTAVRSRRRIAVSRTPRTFQGITFDHPDGQNPTWDMICAVMLRIQARAKITVTWEEVAGESVKLRWWIGHQEVEVVAFREDLGISCPCADCAVYGIAWQVRMTRTCMDVRLAARYMMLFQYGEWRTEGIDDLIGMLNRQLDSATNIATSVAKAGSSRQR